MKKTKSVSDMTIEIIKKEQIKPIPKWEFEIRKWLIWMLCGISILTGAIALSAMTYMIQTNDWDLYYFPYFWLATLFVLTSITLLSYRKTKKGYRTDFFKLLGLVVSLSLVIGLVFSVLGVGKIIDNYLAGRIPTYRQIAPLKYQVWMNPESGTLAGKIISRNENIITVVDLNGKRWQVRIDSQTIIRARVNLDTGTEIKMTGRVTGADKFDASEIRPWLNRFGN